MATVNNNVVKQKKYTTLADKSLSPISYWTLADSVELANGATLTEFINSIDYATTEIAGLVRPDGTTITVDATGTIHGVDQTKTATLKIAGIVKPDGSTITIDEDGTIHGANQTPVASPEESGTVKVNGSNITLDENGILQISNASTTIAGLVKVDGTTISIDENGIISGNEQIGVATSEKAGIVKPDGTNITVDENGTLQITSVVNRIGALETATTILNADSSTNGSVDYKINKALEGFSSLEFLIVDELPNTGIKGTIYLVPSEDAVDQNLYHEYIYYDNKWELIGDTRVDLSDYVKFEDLPTKVSQFENDANYIVDETLDSYALKTDIPGIATESAIGLVKPDGETVTVESDGTIKVDTNNFATTEDIVDLNSSIDSVSVTTPDLIPYTEDELYELAWSTITFDAKPEYTESELDAILDGIDFSGITSGSTEMTSEQMLAVWNNVFTEA